MLLSFVCSSYCWCFFFFFNDTATTEIYTLSLHDALPICAEALYDIGALRAAADSFAARAAARPGVAAHWYNLGATLYRDRKSTRLNSSHDQISYAVFCLKKKKKKITIRHQP